MEPLHAIILQYIIPVAPESSPFPDTSDITSYYISRLAALAAVAFVKVTSKKGHCPLLYVSGGRASSPHIPPRCIFCHIEASWFTPEKAKRTPPASPCACS